MEIAAATNGWIDTTKSEDPEAIAQARKILSGNIYCTLSTSSVDGIPWASPLFFGFDDRLNIYWSSAIAARHSQNLSCNRGRAAIAIFNSEFPEGNPEGLYLTGIGCQLEGEDTELGLQKLQVRARKPNQRTARDYLNDSPRRMYRFVPEAAWLTGERVLWENQLVDTRIALNLGILQTAIANSW